MSSPNVNEPGRWSAERPYPPGYPAPGYQATGFPAPGYPAPGHPIPGYPASGQQPPVPEPRRVGLEWGVAVVVAAVVSALGLGLGLIWSGVAPHVPALRTSDGAVLAQPEQEQMIAAEGWYLIITILAGIAVAVLAWALLRRFRGVPVLVGLAVGAVLAGLLAYWLGHHLGLSHARYLAEHAPVGTAFTIPPNLRVQQVGLWHGWLPYVKGDVLSMAIASVATYILLAGFSAHPTLRPAPAAAAERQDGPPAPLGSAW